MSGPPCVVAVAWKGPLVFQKNTYPPRSFFRGIRTPKTSATSENPQKQKKTKENNVMAIGSCLLDPHLYSILIYILHLPQPTEDFACFCIVLQAQAQNFVHSGGPYPTVSNPGPFSIVIYNTWCHLPSHHVVK